MQYVAPISIGRQLLEGNYLEGMNSCVLLAAHMLPNLLMPVAPALAVTLKGGFVIYSAYQVSEELCEELIGDCDRITEVLGVA